MTCLGLQPEITTEAQPNQAAVGSGSHEHPASAIVPSARDWNLDIFQRCRVAMPEASETVAGVSPVATTGNVGVTSIDAGGVAERVMPCDQSLRCLRHRQIGWNPDPVVAFGDTPATLCDASGIAIARTANAFRRGRTWFRG